jgi:hypothetical protein
VRPVCPKSLPHCSPAPAEHVHRRDSQPPRDAGSWMSSPQSPSSSRYPRAAVEARVRFHLLPPLCRTIAPTTAPPATVMPGARRSPTSAHSAVTACCVCCLDAEPSHRARRPSLRSCHLSRVRCCRASQPCRPDTSVWTSVLHSGVWSSYCRPLIAPLGCSTRACAPDAALCMPMCKPARSPVFFPCAPPIRGHASSPHHTPSRLRFPQW